MLACEGIIPGKSRWRCCGDAVEVKLASGSVFRDQNKTLGWRMRGGEQEASCFVTVYTSQTLVVGLR